MSQYITLLAADEIIGNYGDATWATYSDDEKMAFISRASDRIESLPFKLDTTEGSGFLDNTAVRYSVRPRFHQGYFTKLEKATRRPKAIPTDPNLLQDNKKIFGIISLVYNACVQSLRELSATRIRRGRAWL